MRMKYFSFLPTILLFLVLAGCSSGSSSEKQPLASTNSEPGVTDDAVGEVAPQDDEPGVATGPSTDTSVTITEADASLADETAGTNATDEVDVAEPGESEQSVTDTNAPTDTNSPLVINPDSGFAQLESRVQLLAGATLLDLNQSLNQGELFSAQEDECLGSFEPALGQPILQINCAQPLSVDNSPIFMSFATVSDTAQCRASLQNNNLDECAIAQAELTVNTLWFVPPAAPGQPERPQPKAGAKITMGIVPDRLTLENLVAALSGFFSCEYDTTTAEPAGSSVAANCEDEALRISALIDEHLAN